MWEKQLAAAIKAGELAKRIILDIYKKPFNVEIKDDDSPVTIADKKADAAIRDYLKKQYPSYGFLTEEGKDNKKRLSQDFVWIVDPLDGTSDFVAKNDEFTTNIALSYKGKIVVGVVFIPVTNEIYYATRHGGAFYSINGSVREIHVNKKKAALTILLSVSHHGKAEEAAIKKYGSLISHKKKKGAAIKGCMIAKGEAELSIRLNDKTKEWDTAAQQIIVKEAGGIFVQPDGSEIRYNKKDVVNHQGYIIANKRKNIII